MKYILCRVCHMFGMIATIGEISALALSIRIPPEYV
jgi:hypothetical protein